MKLCLPILLLFVSIASSGQADDCLDRLLAREGVWEKAVSQGSPKGPDIPIKMRFLDAVHNMIRPNYQPLSLVAKEYYSYSASVPDIPVNSYTYNIMAFNYLCNGQEYTVSHETSTRLDIAFNHFNETPLFDTTDDYQLTGFFDLRHGLPVEVRPGIWQFPDSPEPLGFGRTGTRKCWLITLDGKLPWAYVSRREFLVKRNRNLLRLKSEEGPRLKEQLQKWETEKKYKVDQYKNDNARLSAYIDNTYQPGIERENQNFERAVRAYDLELEQVAHELSSPVEELNKQAIVIRNSKNHLNYYFTEKVEPFAEVLTKPNPAYFRKGVSKAIPQLTTVNVIYDHQDPISTRFAKRMEEIIDLDYLRSFIASSAPASYIPQKTTAASGTTFSRGGVAGARTSYVFAAFVDSTILSGTTQLAPSKPVVVGKNGLNVNVIGTLSAPAGASFTLTYNGANDLPVSIPKAPKNQFATVPFSFPKPAADNTPVVVAVKKAPPGIKSVIYKGNAKSRIGADYTYELLTRSTDDKVMSTFYETADVAVGGYKGEEGRYVAFIALKQGFEGSSGKYRQVYWRDRNTGITKLISAAAGEAGNGDSYAPSLSADGQRVVFESNATNLVSNDNNNVKDVFVWNASSNTIELVSKSATGGMADAESFDASISGNGQYVVFSSTASNLTFIPRGQSISNVFVRDLQGGKTELISADPILKSGGSGGKGSISFDGSRISFCSASNRLVPGDNNGLWDIFLWQRGEPQLIRISNTYDGKDHNQGQESATRLISSVISGNGRYVAYSTTASNIVPNDNNNFQDVFVYDIESGEVRIVSQTSDGQPANGDSPIEQGERVSISYDGTWVAFPTKATNLGTESSNIILHNMITGKKQAATNTKGSYVSRPMLSYSGGYVVFGKSENLDSRFGSSGMFAHFTGNGPCRDCKMN